MLCILKVIDCIVLLCIFSFSVFYFFDGTGHGIGRGEKGKEEGEGKAGEGLHPTPKLQFLMPPLVMAFSEEDMTSLNNWDETNREIVEDFSPRKHESKEFRGSVDSKSNGNCNHCLTAYSLITAGKTIIGMKWSIIPSQEISPSSSIVVAQLHLWPAYATNPYCGFQLSHNRSNTGVFRERAAKLSSVKLFYIYLRKTLKYQMHENETQG